MNRQESLSRRLKLTKYLVEAPIFHAKGQPSIGLKEANRGLYIFRNPCLQ